MGNASSRPPIPGILDQWHSQPRRLRIIHVGAGAAGLCFMYKVKTQLTDYEIVTYEKNSDIGGTWLENRYPGCACDIPAHIYTFSFEPNPRWSTYYASAVEIEDYFLRFCDKYDLKEQIKLKHQVTAAIWHEDKAQWEVTVENDGQKFTDYCDILVNGSGLLNKWKCKSYAVNRSTKSFGKALMLPIQGRPSQESSLSKGLSCTQRIGILR
ncbi:hypothetical protein KJ359_012765 [Pestalotiopsis sp. 9143b]|nr:hypothetical protein KJ359_012765 [Pestalotiopsis sp. 9143b]